MKIGYARVSSTGQNEAAQVDLLSRNGAERIFVDKASLRALYNTAPGQNKVLLPTRVFFLLLAASMSVEYSSDGVPASPTLETPLNLALYDDRGSEIHAAALLMPSF